ncbi:MAG: aspartate aminotransferase family protein [Saprospiraceae bacterium]|nr:aspartate aminotransferase family protein [Bacteroidia bacterium]NNL93719.1 aspartate aminotransferase family protein [Saprospiraceae bacterium]
MALSKRDIFLNNIGQTSTYPLALEVDYAEGIFIYDVHGKRYFDLNSGISVSSLGHRHPQVIEAIKNQLDKHLHTMVYGEHIQGPQVAYADLLTSQLDDSLNCIYFLNSGSEVLEVAMKLAKRATGRFEIVSCSNAYHGSTQGAETLRSDHSYSRAFLPLIPGIKHIEFNNVEDLKKITCRTAAVILEPVQAEAGINVPKNDYLRKVEKRCKETKTLFVLDEIQTGFGRTGKMFAHQKYDVIPDLLCIGKAMGGGMPIGGLVGDKKLINLFTKKPDLGHITTFGGHPVMCAAAYASLKTLIDESIVESVLEKEAFILKKLSHPIIKEIRSSGLMMAVELTKRKYLKHVVNHSFNNGALIDYFLFNNRSFRLAPPLIYTMKELDEACDILLSALDFANDKYR